MRFRALNGVNIAHAAISPHTAATMSLAWLRTGITVTDILSNGDRVPATPSACGQCRGIEYGTEGQHVSLLIQLKFGHTVHSPPEPETLSKHQGNIKTLMCKESKDNSHPEASKT